MRGKREIFRIIGGEGEVAGEMVFCESWRGERE